MRLHLRLLALSTCLAISTSVFAADPKPEKAEKTDKPAAKSDKPEKSSGKQAPAGIPPALQTAIDALIAEYEPLMKDQAAVASATVRTTSDYFKENDPGVSQDEILAALSKKLHKDLRVDAYVKWQLIGAQKGEFDEAHAKEALKLYVRPGHRLAPRPGTNQRDQQDLKTNIAKLKPDDVSAANEQWTAMMNYHMAQYRPMMLYREELYARLPKVPEVFTAALQDMNTRMNDGYSIATFLRQVMADLRSTAAGLPSADIRRLASMLQGVNGKMGPNPYDVIEVNDKKAVVWKQAGPVGFDKKMIDETLEALDAMAKAG